MIFNKALIILNKALIITLATCTAAVSLLAAPPDAGAPASKDVVVEVNGLKLTMTDLEQKRASALFQARTSYYEAERKVIEEVVDQTLLEQAAKTENVTLDELLKRHADSTIAPDPTEETLLVYYEGVDTTDPYEAVKTKIVDALRQRRIAKARQAYVQSLRSQGPIVMRLAPPRAPVSMKDVPVRGPANATVTLLEFADYECPYCQTLQPVLDKIESEFKGKVAFAYKDYPLPMHPDAPKAAEAAHCAGAQGKYWEYHDAMFDKKQLDLGSLRTYATELKLDTAAFSKCLDAGQMVGVVNEQAAEAQSLGLQGTPTILVNGRQINGTLNYDKLRSVITEELSAVGGQ